ncbi:Uncharacterised protein [uncultured archaeon]|nr:Uncharacterised protein [uncultured archaeon]
MAVDNKTIETILDKGVDLIKEKYALTKMVPAHVTLLTKKGVPEVVIFQAMMPHTEIISNMIREVVKKSKDHLAAVMVVFLGWVEMRSTKDPSIPPKRNTAITIYTESEDWCKSRNIFVDDGKILEDTGWMEVRTVGGTMTDFGIRDKSKGMFQ